MAQNQDKADRIAIIKAMLESGDMVVQPWQVDAVDQLTEAARRGVMSAILDYRAPLRYDADGMERLVKAMALATTPIITVIPKLAPEDGWPAHPDDFMFRQPKTVPLRDLEDWARPWPARLLGIDWTRGMATIGARPSRGWRRHRRREKAVARRRS